jgi:hypothetical protein
MSIKIPSVLTVAALAAACAVAVPSKAAADDRTDCQKRVEKAQDHYRHEAHEHGKHSRQAQNARAKLNETWDRCWSATHSWYDPHRERTATGTATTIGTTTGTVDSPFIAKKRGLCAAFFFYRRLVSEWLRFYGFRQSIDARTSP